MKRVIHNSMKKKTAENYYAAAILGQSQILCKL